MRTLFVAALLALASPLSAQVIAPCVAITGRDSTRAEKCIPVPVVLPPVDTIIVPPIVGDSAVWSLTMGSWAPTRAGECSADVHNRYSVVAADGKRYATWHPPVDPSGCAFGHEHGDDPRTWAAYDPTDVPYFGGVVEAAFGGPSYHAMQNHVGFKFLVANRATFSATPAAEAKVPLGPQACDVLAEIHQGSGGAARFTRNLHEQATRVRCDNGFAFDVQLLSAIGKAGTMTDVCTGKVIPTGDYVPLDSPTSSPQNPGGSMGDRFVPTASCVETDRPKSGETWKTQNPIIGVDGRDAVRFAWYWSMGDVSTYYTPTGAGRMMDQCYRKVDGVYQVISNPCLTFRRQHPEPVAWDDPASAFTSVARSVKLNDFQYTNATGPEVFYTDVLGLNGSPSPFPGSVRQYVRRGYYPYPLGGPTVGGNFAAPGVHAPN